MEKINLKDILTKHILLQSKGDGPISHTEAALSAMKEIWNIAVDECKKAAVVDIDYMQETPCQCTVDGDSIEEVKKMIL